MKTAEWGSESLGDGPWADSTKLNWELIWRMTINKAADKAQMAWAWGSQEQPSWACRHLVASTGLTFYMHVIIWQLSSSNSQARKKKSREICFNSLCITFLSPPPKSLLFCLYTLPTLFPREGNQSMTCLKTGQNAVNWLTASVFLGILLKMHHGRGAFT